MNDLIKALQPYHNEIYGTLEPFCDDKEQGLMLSLYNQLTNDSMYLWCCEDIVKQDLMIVSSYNKAKKNLYMQSDRENAQYFSRTNFDEAISYSLTQVNKFLKKDLNINI